MIMNINDVSVLEKLNELIASNRLNNNQTLHLINLAVISNNFNDLYDNLKWESFKKNIKKR